MSRRVENRQGLPYNILLTVKTYCNVSDDIGQYQSPTFKVLLYSNRIPDIKLTVKCTEHGLHKAGTKVLIPINTRWSSRPMVWYRYRYRYQYQYQYAMVPYLLRRSHRSGNGSPP